MISLTCNVDVGISCGDLEGSLPALTIDISPSRTKKHVNTVAVTLHV